MLILNRAEVRRALTMPEAIAAVGRAFADLSAGLAEVPQRLAMDLPDRAVTLIMPAYLRGEHALGGKFVSVHPSNRERGLPTIHALVVLIDDATGRPLAALEGGALTAIRTGAASGAATAALARPEARVLACFGAGVQAETQVEAVCAVRPIERVWIIGRTLESALKLAGSIAGRAPIPVDVRASVDPGPALAEADVVCTATTSETPVFDGRLLRPGTHVNAVGSFSTAVREVDSEAVRRASIVVDSRPACLAEAGDLVIPMAEGRIGGPETWTELGEVLIGRSPGRPSADAITFFKSVGNAVQDLAAATQAVRQAKRLGLGSEVDLEGS